MINWGMNRLDTQFIQFARRWGLVTVSSIIPLGVAWQFRHAIAYDDTYITLTYARNIAQGHGFVYNGGPIMLGTTSPLLALWLGFWGAVLQTNNMAQLALITGALAWAGTVWLAFWLGEQLQGPAAGKLMAILMATLAIWPHVLRAEFPLLMAFSLLALVLSMRQRYGWAGIFFGLACLTRGDAALLAGLSGLAILWQKRRVPWRLVGGFSLVLAPWFLYASLTFGNPLPATLDIKRAHRAYGIWPHIITGFWRWFQRTAWPFQLRFALTVLLAPIALTRRNLWATVLLGWGLLHALSYTWLNVPFYFWYVLPIFVIASLGAGLTLATYKQKKLSGVLLMVLVVLGGVGLNNAVARAERVNPRSQAYLDTAAWLKNNTTPDSTVGYIEIGILAYFSQRPVLDLLGLTTPGAATYLQQGDIGPYFETLRPDYYIRNSDIDNWKMCKQINKRSYFQQAYHPVATIPQRHRKPIIIYQRTDKH